MPGISEKLWSDDGSLGYGYIHGPEIPHITVLTFGSVWHVALPEMGGTFDVKSGVFSASSRKGNPLSALDGEVFASSDALLDRLASIRPYVVITAPGGTCYLVRGELPRDLPDGRGRRVGRRQGGTYVTVPI